MDGNKDEAEKCIQIAQKLINCTKKFLQKAERLYPTQKAKDLLLQINLLAPASPETEQSRKHNTNPVSEKIPKAPEYTREQIEAVRKIKRCKGYYEILGVSKEAKNSEIKKAYKKLALQFHPDKNKAPGSAEVFKVIGKALAILTDVKKRKQYDLYRNDEERTAKNSHFNSQPFTQGFKAEESPEDLFGGGFGGSNFYDRRNGQKNGQRPRTSQYENQRQRNEQQVGYGAFLLLFFFILAIILSMKFSFITSEPVHNFSHSPKYSVERTTQNLKITYYVKKNFHTEDQDSIQRLEMLVEEDFITSLQHSCYREKNHRKCFSLLYYNILRVLLYICKYIVVIFGFGCQFLTSS